MAPMSSLKVQSFCKLISIHSYQFPSLQTLGEDLITVLDFLHVRYAVGLGEGAGANVLARCGLAHPRRLLGLILVNCTASTSSVADAFRSRFSRWRGADISQSEEDFLIYHKFGHVSFENEKHFSYQVFLPSVFVTNTTNCSV